MQHAGQTVLRNLLAIAPGVFEFPAPVAGNITRVEIFARAANANGDATFDVNVNDVSIWAADQTQRIKLLAGQTSAEVSGLAVAVARGQWLTVDCDVLPAGGFPGKIGISITIEDNASAPPTGAAGGALAGFFPDPALSAEAVQQIVAPFIADSSDLDFTHDDAGNSLSAVLKAISGLVAGTYGSGAAIPVITLDAKGRVTGVTTVAPTVGGDLGGTLAAAVVNQLKGRSLGGIPSVAGFLSDNFNDNVINTSLWTVIGGTTKVFERNARLEIEGGTGSFTGLRTTASYDFRSKFASVRVSQVMTTAASVEMLFGINWTGWEYQFRVDDGNLRAYLWNSNTGTVTDTNLGAFSTVTHAYLRLRHATGQFYWDTSTDGQTWTQRHNIANAQAGLSAGKVELSAFASSAAHGMTIFDTFNTDVPLTDPISLQNLFGVVWDNPNNQFSLLRSLGVLSFVAAGAPPSGAPANLPAGHTLGIVEMTTPLKLHIWNTSSLTWDMQQF